MRDVTTILIEQLFLFYYRLTVISKVLNNCSAVTQSVRARYNQLSCPFLKKFLFYLCQRIFVINVRYS